MVGPYRDNRAALEARSAELDRALSRLPQNRARSLPVLLAGMLLLFIAAMRLVASVTAAAPAYAEARRFEHMLARARDLSGPSLPKERTLKAHVLTGNFSDLDADAECAIQIAPPCQTTVHCGRILYSGNGSCADGFVDAASAELDGTPQCLIDLANRHVVIVDGDAFVHLELE